MTVLSAQTIRRLNLLTPCLPPYKDIAGNSAGLSACGYDLTLAENVWLEYAGFSLAVAEEFFNLPSNVCAIVHDKSTWARRGIAVQNTIAEPGWFGYLTLELTNHGPCAMQIRKGQAIAQVVFHFLDEHTELPYRGKYQNQGKEPIPARSYE